MVLSHPDLWLGRPVTTRRRTAYEEHVWLRTLLTVPTSRVRRGSAMNRAYGISSVGVLEGSIFFECVAGGSDTIQVGANAPKFEQNEF